MKKFGFIGSGKMASAIVGGMLKAKVADKSEIGCVGGNDDTAKILSEKTGVFVFASPSEVCANSETVVLACKPQQLKDVSKNGAGCPQEIPLLISILAGTTLKKLRESFPHAKNIVRVMPNMAAQIGMGISCYAPEKALEESERKIVKSVLGGIGEFMESEEHKLDAVTALSGSGPGYIFEFAAALIAGGEEIGFTQEEAKKLTYATLLGSAMLLEKSPLSAEELRNAVSSKGGTTLAGLEEFTKSNFRKTVSDCLKAAAKRSSELAKM